MFKKITKLTPVIILSLLSMFFFYGCSSGGGGSTSSSDKKEIDKPPFLGRQYIGSSRCTYCHDNAEKEWKSTKHSTAFAVVSGTGGDTCIRCHTTGFDKKKNNGGYDENRVKKLRNVGCESCHEAAAKYAPHYNARSSRVRYSRTRLALKASICGECHTKKIDGSQSKGQYDQWVNSAFPGSLSIFKGHPEADNSCLKCHSADRIYDSSVTTKSVKNPVTCAACHNPHGSDNDFQLRAQGDFTLPGESTPVSAANSAICYECHNDQIEDIDKAVNKGDLPRYNQAQMLSGAGGYEFGETINDSFHSGIADRCLACHGYDTPDEGTAGHNTIGGHTFRVVDDDGNKLLSACQQCHDGLDTFNRTARGDYDGDGSTEGIQSETEGLLEVLKTEILKSGNVSEKSDSFGRTYFSFSDSATDAEKQAAFNWGFVSSDKSGGIHNTGYAVKLLQISFKNLSGIDVPGADIR